MAQSRSCLVPAGLSVVSVAHDPDAVTITATPTASTATCPKCGTRSSSVHSRRHRRLDDVPWVGRPVVLDVAVRRFRCRSPSCPRQTFVERLPGVMAPFARRTDRLGGLQRHIALALGGEAGTRLAERLTMPTSADTMLRLIRKAAVPNHPPVRVLGVDDWAWRRGRRYGTILVDLERNAVVDLLPDRESETLARWLRTHPGIAVVARDRADAYADAIRRAAPAATAVTDRWHLLRNLGDAMAALVRTRHAALHRAARAVAGATAPEPKPSEPEPMCRRGAGHAGRRARYADAVRLHADGASISLIARDLALDRKTVRVWLAGGGPPAWERRRPALGPTGAHRAFLERRWRDGCTNVAALWRELSASGADVSARAVRDWVTIHRRSAGRAATHADGVDRQAPPSVTRMAMLLQADPLTLSAGDCGLVDHVLADDPELARAVDLARRLRAMLRKEASGSLDDWLADAHGSALAGFAKGLAKDRDAIDAALSLPWTTSPVEGKVNRLKTIKRAMHGRAGFDLLRQRVLASRLSPSLHPLCGRSRIRRALTRARPLDPLVVRKTASRHRDHRCGAPCDRGPCPWLSRPGHVRSRSTPPASGCRTRPGTSSGGPSEARISEAG
jgi:transposase